MNTKLLIGAAIVLILGFLYVSYTTTNPVVQNKFPAVAKIQKSASDSATIADHTQGTGKRVLAEFADLQCPACRTFHDYLKSEMAKDPTFSKLIREEYTFVYRHFPLVNIHQHAQIAAQAAEAAGLQGKFFEFVDVAYAKQDEWVKSEDPREQFKNYATDLGLDTLLFKEDTESAPVKQKIERDIQAGLAANLQATPSFYIDGEAVSGFGSFDEFKKILIEKVTAK
ncbi:MAG: thioredoxin domain-containing protein [Candidatus Roizmanbacteria bacterium]